MEEHARKMRERALRVATQLPKPKRVKGERRMRKKTYKRTDQTEAYLVEIEGVRKFLNGKRKYPRKVE